jgi:hypothetical protein
MRPFCFLRLLRKTDPGASRPRRARGRHRLALENLEDRTVPSTLYVVPPGAPLDASHFTSYNDAFHAANGGDVIQMEQGTAISSVGPGLQGTRAADGTAGANAITVAPGADTIPPGELVTISGGGGADEMRLVKAAIFSSMRPPSPLAFTTTLLFTIPLSNDHSGQTVASVATGANAGTGYAVGNMVTLSGGTSSTQASFVVDTVGTGGAVTALHVLNGGLYSVPTGRANVATTTSGGGVNLTVNVSYSSATVTTLGTLGIDRQLTIQGDVGAPVPITGRMELLAGANGVTFRGINYTPTDPITIDPASTQTSIVNSIISGVRMTGNPGARVVTGSYQGDVIDSNIITRNLVLNNMNMGQITNNVFTYASAVGAFALEETSSNGVLIQGNTFNTSNVAALRLVDSDNLQILNNSITISNASADVLAAIHFWNDGIGFNTSVTIKNNVINTGGLEPGLKLQKDPPGSGITNGTFAATVEGNDFHNSSVGIEVQGDGTSSGNLDFGVGAAGGRGANDFRGFTAAGTAAGKFAIYQHKTGVNANVNAGNNIWSVADPNTVNKDQVHNSAVGGGDIGTGNIIVLTVQLTADEQYVQTLYNRFLGRSGALSEIDGWVAALPSMGRSGVADKVIRSTEALRRVVDSYYLKYLGRTADGGGEAGWITFLQQGGTEEKVIAGFASSLEYVNRVKDTFGGVDSSYIQSLYNKFFGRNAGPDEVAGWLNLLPSMSREAVVAGFVNSAEFRGNAVRQFYTDLLHRPTAPPSAEVANWVNTPLDILSIEVAFASSGEYYLNG